MLRSLINIIIILALVACVSEGPLTPEGTPEKFYQGHTDPVVVPPPAELISSDETAVAGPETTPPEKPPIASKRLQPKPQNESHRNKDFSSGAVMSQRIQPDMGLTGKDIRSRVKPAYQPPQESINRETYADISDNRIKVVSEEPVSTFSIDVDTGSYSNVRRMIKQGRLPPKNAVRVEEMINYFTYNYPLPEDNKTPFNVVTEIAPAPWNGQSLLLHIGIKGYDIDKRQLPAANLVFLIDVSGSMNKANKLGLLKSSLTLLTKQLRQQDRIAIVVYAGSSGVVLEPTPGNQTDTITDALNRLRAGGSTNGGAGIQLAYNVAQQNFKSQGINRIILATDGDFNVGMVNFKALKKLVERKRKSGITLTTLGFGSGNYNDHLMEQLADSGNGNYQYIDSLNEANKVLVQEMSSTLQTIAKDVKIQIEFNPDVVAEYRLIGYENRVLAREDFNNDKVDAGDIGAGHTVTALYEITLKNSQGRRVDELRHNNKNNNHGENSKTSSELAFLKMRYKLPSEDQSSLRTWPIKLESIKTNIDKTHDRFKFSAAVAAFAQILKGGQYTGQFSLEDVVQLGKNSRGQDPFGYRNEFIQIVQLAKSLK